MGFPTLLVILFFATLNFNHRVLYAPSDYQNEDNFFRAASPSERAAKLDEDVAEATADSAEAVTEATALSEAPAIADGPSRSPREIRARALLAEELVLNKLSQEFGQSAVRDIKFTGQSESGHPYVFDGAIVLDRAIMAIEVKYLTDIVRNRRRLRDTLYRTVRSIEGMSRPSRRRFALILAVATDTPASSFDEVRRSVQRAIGLESHSFMIDIRFYNLEDLEREAGLSGQVLTNGST